MTRKEMMDKQRKKPTAPAKKVYAGSEDEIVRQLVIEQKLQSKRCNLNDAVKDISNYVGPTKADKM
jgi:hypothetical protein